MPDQKVSSLTASGALTGAELFYADNGSNDVKVTATQVQIFAQTGGALLASANTFTAAQTITGGTVTSSTPVLNLAQSWNAGGVTFTAIKLNVTPTAQAATSLLIDLQASGTSRFNVDYLGNASVSGGYIGPGAVFGAGQTYGLSMNYYANNGAQLGSSAVLSWTNGGPGATVDTGILRSVQQVVGLSDGISGAGHGATFAAAANTPASLASGTTHNYAISQASYFQRLTANSSNSTLTGISVNSGAQVDGETHTIVNVAPSGTLTLNHQDTNSTAANRFICSTGANIMLNAGQAADAIYDGTQSRWLIFKRN